MNNILRMQNINYRIWKDSVCNKRIWNVYIETSILRCMTKRYLHERCLTERRLRRWDADRCLIERCLTERCLHKRDAERCLLERCLTERCLHRWDAERCLLERGLAERCLHRWRAERCLLERCLTERCLHRWDAERCLLERCLTERCLHRWDAERCLLERGLAERCLHRWRAERCLLERCLTERCLHRTQREWEIWQRGVCTGEGQRDVCWERCLRREVSAQNTEKSREMSAWEMSDREVSAQNMEEKSREMFAWRFMTFDSHLIVGHWKVLCPSFFANRTNMTSLTSWFLTFNLHSISIMTDLLWDWIVHNHHWWNGRIPLNRWLGDCCSQCWSLLNNNEIICD